MLKVGLTGNYFSGIEEISNIYKKLRIPVFEVDLIIKFMLYNNQDTIKKIRQEFGSVVFMNHKVDINAFRGTSTFTRLMKVLELDLVTTYEKWRLVNKAPFTVFKTQILFESNWNNLMNFNISVFKPTGIRVGEIQDTYKMRSTEAWALLDTEIDPFQKNRLCNYTIHNYESYNDSVETQITNINKSISNKALAF